MIRCAFAVWALLTAPVKLLCVQSIEHVRLDQQWRNEVQVQLHRQADQWQGL